MQKRMLFKAVTPLRAGATFAASAAIVIGSVGLATSDAAASSTKATLAHYKAPPANACKGKTLGEADISTTISFLAVMDNAMAKEARRLGMRTTVLGANLDNGTEVSNIEDLIAKKVDVIDVTSQSPTAVGGAVRQAWAAHIPVIAVNAPLAPSVKVVTYEGDANYQYGQGIGRLILKALPKGGKIALLVGPLGDSVATARTAGIKSVIRSHKDIKIVATEVDNFDNPTALADTQDLLSKYPKGTLQAIVAEGPEIFVGADYARAHGYRYLKFIGGDYPKQVAAAIRSGAMYGTVDQSPVLEGKLGADFACDYLLGKKSLIPSPTALVPLPIITKANVRKVPAVWDD